MMEFLSERFAPGPLFGWLCLVSFGLIPLVWISWRAAGGTSATAGGRYATIRFSSLDLLGDLGTTWASRLGFVIPLLRTLAILALIVALARPQSGGSYHAAREGIAIQMVLDVSGSMAERDFVLDGRPARRLDAVKEVFRDFVLGVGNLGSRENDLIGMTTFAMYADTPCPLTLDHGSLVDLLREAEIPGWVDGQQVREHQEAGYTALGEAIVLASDHLRRAGEQAVAGVPGADAAKSRVMILLTDGKDNPAPRLRGAPPPPDSIDVAKVAATLGIKIYTIGAVGAARRGQSPMGFFAQPGAAVDEPTLKRIAAITGGKYYRATDTGSLVEIYDDIDQLERRSTGERVFRDNLRAAKVAMLIGLAMMAAELLLMNTRYRRIP